MLTALQISRKIHVVRSHCGDCKVFECG